MPDSCSIKHAHRAPPPRSGGFTSCSYFLFIYLAQASESCPQRLDVSTCTGAYGAWGKPTSLTLQTPSLQKGQEQGGGKAPPARCHSRVRTVPDPASHGTLHPQPHSTFRMASLIAHVHADRPLHKPLIHKPFLPKTRPFQCCFL